MSFEPTEGEIFVCPDEEIDREARMADLREGVSRWQWACRDAGAKYRRRKMARAEFRNLNQSAASQEVHARIRRWARRQDVLCRLRANALLLVAAFLVLGAALFLLVQIFAQH